MLEIQQRLQTTLGDLRLIRRVSGIPARVFQDVAQNYGRRDGAVVAHTDKAGPELVLFRVAPQARQCFLFIQRGRQRQVTLQANRRRHGLLDQLFTAGQAERIEHGLLFTRIRAKMATQKGVRLLEL